MLIDLGRCFKALLGVFRRKVVHFGLLFKFLDQIENCPIEVKKVEVWKFSPPNNKYHLLYSNK